MNLPTAVIITFGCRSNQADGAQLAESLRQHGFRIGNRGEAADLIVINSCTVTVQAAEKTHRAVKAARRRCPRAVIAVTGCDPQVDRTRWKRETAADLILDNSEKFTLVQYLPDRLLKHPRGEKHFSATTLQTGGRGPAPAPAPASGRYPDRTGFYPHRTRANLKIQEGCDCFCSYCIVPYARGTPVSRPADEVLREARGLLDRGHRELVLTGINLGRYRDDGITLVGIIKRILAIPGEFRLRISSIEPGPVVFEVLEIMADTAKICRFLHLPLQSGDDTILQAMNRSYSVREYTRAATAAVDMIPGLCLGSDLMVGFPGETEAGFDNSLTAVERIPFGNLHVFHYSPRPGTAAATMSGRIAPETAIRRQRRMQVLADAKENLFAIGQIRDTVQVLVEKQDRGGTGSGWSDNYLRVTVSDLPADSVGRLVKVRITGIIQGRHVQAVFCREPGGSNLRQI